ncbi:MAG: NAD(P)-dependent malic enzyme [Candidatus Hadarchaeum sp.]|uniref:NAD(P)-dependent malic enzyme n=1 Tax=Candidatus Hadarchaeum sp. TaxID=2883567 RepID=UPI003D0CB786
MSLKDDALALHRRFRGKIATAVKVPLRNQRDLVLAYTPGVAEVSREIARNPESVFDYTSKWNTIAVVTDGSRVLGLGNIGAAAALPVMEGKAALFKAFGDVDAVPLCLSTQDAEEIIAIVKAVSPSFGGINLEDIETPKVLEIKERLINELDIPVFHDDGDGTAVVALAGLLNALKVVDKRLDEVSITIAGAGSAGYEIARILHRVGARKILVVDSRGIIHRGRKEGMNRFKEALAQITNPDNIAGGLGEALRGADVFIGVSGVPNLLSAEMIKSMAEDPIVFALTNPDPEILPDAARKAGARVVATGSSQFPNQANNLLVFPGFFRGLLDSRAKKVTDEMKVAAAGAIAGLVKKGELDVDHILPRAVDKKIARRVAAVVRASVKKQG